MPEETVVPEMRIQLQVSHSGQTSNTYGMPVAASDPDRGVTPLELRSAMQELYRVAMNLEVEWFPANNMESKLVEAIVVLSERIKKYEESGISGDRNIERYSWEASRGREYRVDIENKRGLNLRVK